MRSACPWPWKISNNRFAQGGAVFGGGGKGGGGGTTYQTQTVSIPPEVLARYNAVNARAEQAAQQPFQAYEGQFVAPLNPTQEQAISQMGSAATSYQPYYMAGTQALGQNAGQMNQYYGQAGQNIQGALGTGAPYLGAATTALGAAQAASAPYMGAAYNAASNAQQAAQPLYGQAQAQIGAGLQASQPYYTGAMNQYTAAQQAAAPYMGAVNEQVRAAQQAGQPYNQAALNAYANAQTAGLPMQQAAAGSLQQAAAAGQPYLQAAQSGLGAAQQAALPFLMNSTEAIRQAQAQGQPYLGTAAQAAQQGSSAVAPSALDIQKYSDPYVQSVLNPTMAALRQQQQAEQSQLAGAQAMRGAFGGDRGAIAAANLARQQDIASAQTEAGLRSQAYQQGLAAAQQQQGVNLAAEQANRAAQQQYAQQALAIGQQAFQQPAAVSAAMQQIGQQAFNQPAQIAQQQAALGQQAFNQPVALAQAQQGLGQQGYAQALGAGQALQGLGQQVYQQPMAAAGLYQQQAQQAFNQPMAVGQGLQGLGTAAFQNPLAASQAYSGLGQAAFQNPMALAQTMGQLGQQAFQQPFQTSQQYGALGQQGYQQLLGAAQAQQALGQGYLGAGQNIAQTLAALGSGGQQAGLAGAQALLGAGTLGQQTQQALNQAYYNQFLQQQGYPFQVAQFLANIAEGTGALSGSTTSGVTTQPTSFFSDERVKKNVKEIGKTHDGQPIIKFDYEDEPDGTGHIGLSAQATEKKHPDAVHETAEGIKAVDYDKATKDAERPHAYGGGLIPSSEGGAVTSDRAGLGFANGGSPDYMRQVYELMTAKTGSVPGGLGQVPYGKGYVPPLRESAPRQLMKANLPTPAPVQSGLEQGLGAMQRASGTAKAATDLYKMGKEGLVGSKGTKGEPDTGGLLGRAGEFDPDKGWFGSSTETKPSAAGGARTGYADGGMPDYMQSLMGMYQNAPWAGGQGARSFMPSPQGGGSHPALKAAELKTPQQAKGMGLSDISSALDIAKTVKGGATDILNTIKEKQENQKIADATIPKGQDMQDLVKQASEQTDIAGGVWKKGGRVHFAQGGFGALPFSDASRPFVPEAVIDEGDEEAKGKKLDAPKLPSVGSGGGGGGSGLGDIASILKSGATLAAMFAAHGGRIHRAEGGDAPADQPPKQDDFLGALTPHVLKASQQTGLDPRLILAQSALETGYGKAAPGYNYFGIKSHGRPGGQVLQTQEQGPNGMYSTRDSFRAYHSPEQSVQDYANFINQNALYEKARKAQGLDAQIEEMGKSGYASDREYANKLRSIANNIEVDPKTGTARFIKPVQTYAPQPGLGSAPTEQQQGGGQQNLGNIQDLLERFKTPMGTGISNRPERSFKDWATSESTIVPGLTAIGAMLSGGSPYLLPNIGMGLMAGAQSYGDLAKNIRRQDIEQQQTDISQQQTDAAIMARLQTVANDINARRNNALRQGNYQEAQSYDAYLNQIQAAIVARSGLKNVNFPTPPGTGGAGAPGGGAGMTPAGGGAAPGQPTPITPQAQPAQGKGETWREQRAPENFTVSVTGKRIEPNMDPAEIRRRASFMIGDAAKQEMDRADKLALEYKQSGLIPVVGGGNEIYEGYEKNKEQIANQALNNKWKETFNAGLNARREAKAILSSMADIAKNYTPNSWASQKAQLENALFSAGINIPPQISSAGDYETLMKYANQQAIRLGQTGASGLTNEKLSTSLATVPNPSQNPAAFKNVLANQIATVEMQDKYERDLQKAVAEVPYVDQTKFAAWWSDQPENSLSERIKKVKENMAVSGDVSDLSMMKPGSTAVKTLTIQELKGLAERAGKPLPEGMKKGGTFRITRDENGQFHLAPVKD